AAGRATRLARDDLRVALLLVGAQDRVDLLTHLGAHALAALAPVGVVHPLELGEAAALLGEDLVDARRLRRVELEVVDESLAARLRVAAATPAATAARSRGGCAVVRGARAGRTPAQRGVRDLQHVVAAVRDD